MDGKDGVCKNTSIAREIGLDRFGLLHKFVRGSLGFKRSPLIQECPISRKFWSCFPSPFAKWLGRCNPIQLSFVSPTNTVTKGACIVVPYVLSVPVCLGKKNFEPGIMSYESKVFAITGGASGIGLETAKILSKRGATVCICDVDAAAMKDAESYFTEQGVSFMVSKVDVSKRAEVESWINAILDKYGRMDGAANVAGIIGKHHGLRPVAEQDDDEWDRIIAVNLTGCMYCMRAELRKIADGGSIVNVASIHGLTGKPVVAESTHATSH